MGSKGSETLTPARDFSLELFDQDSGYDDGISRHWLRADRYTQGQAKYAARHDIDDGADNDWRNLRVCKVWCRYDEQWIAEMIADGSTEPYDGWQLTLCKETDDGAVAYWQIEGGVAE